jgi:Ca-activated chloride channel homolog
MKKGLIITAIGMLLGLLLLSACGGRYTTVPYTVAGTTQQAITTTARPTVPVVTTPPIVSVIVPSATSRPMMTQPAPTATYNVPAYTYPAATTRPPATDAPSVGGGSGTVTPVYTYPAAVPATTSTGTIGLSAGGAKDVANFRENILNHYLPIPTDVTYEGLFYDYYFDTGAGASSNKLFSPSYSFAVTRDPISHQTEYYLSVGLNSGLKESDFQRKPLNLVIVLDSSGSMGENFNQYYYDGDGKQIDAYEGSGIYRAKKIDSAKEAILSILDQLTDNDRFAIVQFNSTASLVKPMGRVGEINITSVKNNVLNLQAGGSTNLTSGIELAADQLRNSPEAGNAEYESRLIILTDAQPNTGDISAGGMSGRIQSNAASRIFTTFIGIGVDFNSQLVEEITRTKGSNYYSVHSPREFKQRVDEEFDFMVTPLVFNLQLKFESAGWRIEKVFGSPEASEATGELMKINTMFPAPKSEGGETRGGLVLLKLRKTSSNSNEPVYLRAAYEDRNGRYDSSSVTIVLESTSPEFFDNSGLRKGILLTRYAALLENWMIDERQHLNYSRPWDPCVREDTGIIIPVVYAGQWERQSQPLTVSEPYRSLFHRFSSYFEQEMGSIRDSDLNQELRILKTLAG